MTTGTADPTAARPATGQRWTARAAFAAMVVRVASEGPIGLTLLGVGLLGTVAVLVGGFWFIAKRGVLRWVGLAAAGDQRRHRNHFALDLGLDREDPSTRLPALTDGEEVRVDLGCIGDRPFVNQASFGSRCSRSRWWW